MDSNHKKIVQGICQDCNLDKTRLMDVVRAVQAELGCVSEKSMQLIAEILDTHRVEVEGVVSFYAFLSEAPKGKTVVRLCDDIVDRFQGSEAVGQILCETLELDFGQTSADGSLSLDKTPCIGMSDQAPALLVNDVVLTRLTPERAREIGVLLKAGAAPDSLTSQTGDGLNSSELIASEVNNNVIEAGEVLMAPATSGAAIKNSLTLSPEDVINAIKTSGLRGRGGAGFPTGMKWDFTRKASDGQACVLCNADEGEPGTFKDRVLLTEKAELLFEGMGVAAYAVGATTGILYLRAEYAYLRKHLESVLADMRKEKLLGNGIAGKTDFNFDIRIQMGAGAYICGEETALISSCEGLRGDPKNRPPFPANKGYMQRPTTVNNVETLCCAARILEKGADWFAAIGTKDSPGTKMLSVSGDCDSPGIYELPFGLTINNLLKKCGATNTGAVLVGGPSGQLINPQQFGRKICFEDLPTGGSMVIFNKTCNLFEIIKYYGEFFAEESCGYCTPCRVGITLLQERLEKIIDGQGQPSDIPYLEGICSTMKAASRCGLGQTACNPISSSMTNFPDLYKSVLREPVNGMQPGFDLHAATAVASEIAGRPAAKAGK